MEQPVNVSLGSSDAGPIDEHALECLRLTRINSFTANPSTLQPFGGGTTISWSVNVPPGCGLRITLNGQPVAASGTQQVQPAATTSYTLAARVRQATRVLDRVVVRVDTSRCISGAVPESLIRLQIQRAVDALDQADDRFSKRSEPRIEVDAHGIHVALRFKLALENFADPSVDIDFTVGLRVRSGSAEPFYRRFAVDVDWPWWVTVVTAGVSKIVEEFIDEKVEGALKPRVLNELRNQIEGFINLLPGDLRLHMLGLAENEIRVTACPDGDDVPFLVVSRAIDGNIED